MFSLIYGYVKLYSTIRAVKALLSDLCICNNHANEIISNFKLKISDFKGLLMSLGKKVHTIVEENSKKEKLVETNARLILFATYNFIESLNCFWQLFPARF